MTRVTKTTKTPQPQQRKNPRSTTSRYRVQIKPLVTEKEEVAGTKNETNTPEEKGGASP